MVANSINIWVKQKVILGSLISQRNIKAGEINIAHTRARELIDQFVEIIRVIGNLFCLVLSNNNSPEAIGQNNDFWFIAFHNIPRFDDIS